MRTRNASDGSALFLAFAILIGLFILFDDDDDSCEVDCEAAVQETK